MVVTAPIHRETKMPVMRMVTTPASRAPGLTRPCSCRVSNSFRLYLQTIARLKPGVSVEQAQAQMTQIAAALEKANPEWNKGHLAGVRPLRDHLVGAQTRSWMLMLLGAVGIVLVIACANVANLLLARRERPRA